MTFTKKLQLEVNDLRTEVQLLKNGRNSHTSSTPSSLDYGRSNKYNSRKNKKNIRGHKGHKGSSLKNRFLIFNFAQKRDGMTDYFQVSKMVKEFENTLSVLLEFDYSNKHKKQKAFVNRLLKNRNNILTFLYCHEVPPDNNGSERAIRMRKKK